MLGESLPPPKALFVLQFVVFITSYSTTKEKCGAPLELGELYSVRLAVIIDFKVRSTP